MSYIVYRSTRKYNIKLFHSDNTSSNLVGDATLVYAQQSVRSVLISCISYICFTHTVLTHNLDQAEYISSDAHFYWLGIRSVQRLLAEYIPIEV